jgi:ABC-2 type transport system permease protein
MRHYPLLLAHELRMLAVSVATYSAAVLFLLFMGLIYFLVLYGYNGQIESDPPMTQYFQLFFFPVFFVVPLLTMKSLADEQKHGTLEAMLATPATTLEIVLAKFSAAYLFYIGLWAVTLFFPFITLWFVPGVRADSPLHDTASLAGGFLFIAASGLLYIALGILASSLTRNTLVAGMLSFSLLFVLIISGYWLTKLNLQDSWLIHAQSAVDYLQTFRQLEDFSRGIVDTRPFFLYASNTLLVLGVTSLVVESRATA